jgi:thioredoxin-dependent peroxiredoxin
MAAKKRPAKKASRRPTTSPRAAKPPAKAKAAPKRKAKAAARGAVEKVTAKAAPAKAAPAKAAPGVVRKKVPSKSSAPQRVVAEKAPALASPAAGAGVSKGVGEGDRAPGFTLSDQAGAPVSSDDLAGKPYILYFYPKDDTPGCTTEACGFRDSISEFDGIGVRVLGVSPDSVATHQRFVGKYGLPFTLLSDPARELASAYGVWAMKKLYGRESMGIVRSTFLVDGDGVVRKAWRNVRVAGHVPEVQAAAARLG